MDTIVGHVKTQLVPLVGKKCATKLIAFENNSECISLLVSKLLGFGIIAGAAVVKVPQIAKIVNSGNTKGISLASYWMETIAFIVFLAYNYRSKYPFSTYGEGVFLVLQNLVVIALMFIYKAKFINLIVAVIGLGAFGYVVFHDEYVTSALLDKLQLATIFLGVGSKLPQIVSNHFAQSTGQLSAVTLLLQFVGTLARVFTTQKEVKDQLLIVSSIVAAVLNGLLVLQVGIYPSGTKTKKAKAPKKKAQ